MHRCLFLFHVYLLPLGLLGQERVLFQTITVPIDYENPDAGTTKIACELGAAFSKGKPTVFVIADAQQFYVRKGVIAELQASLFGAHFNVVGIIGRNNNDDLKSMVIDENGGVDWVKAYTVFSWQQYINDINEAGKEIVGKSGHIYLYGQSGGGYLVHQFLSVYGRFVDKAFYGLTLKTCIFHLYR